MTARSTSLVSASIGLFAGLVLAFFGLSSPARNAAVAANTVDDKEKQVGDMKAAWSALDERVMKLENQIVFSPPVGTVMAYAGDWPEEQDKQLERERAWGWMLCDGRQFKDMPADLQEQLADLKEILSKTAVNESLPDYRGLFLRGVDRNARRDKDSWLGDDNTSAERPYSPRAVNSSQEDWTRRPRRRDFSTGNDDKDGDHDHQNGSFNQLLKNDGKETSTSRDNDPGGTWEPNLSTSQPMGRGIHHHTIRIGGDYETRPINCAVHWIIKFKSDNSTRRGNGER